MARDGTWTRQRRAACHLDWVTGILGFSSPSRIARGKGLSLSKPSDQISTRLKLFKVGKLENSIDGAMVIKLFQIVETPIHDQRRLHCSLVEISGFFLLNIQMFAFKVKKNHMSTQLPNSYIISRVPNCLTSISSKADLFWILCCRDKSIHDLFWTGQVNDGI